MDKSIKESEYFKMIEDVYNNSLRNNAKPPIRGEITAGKIRYRGIRQVTIPYDGTSWLEQRGKRISPIIKRNGEIVL
jgi:hypothetical protein